MRVRANSYVFIAYPSQGEKKTFVGEINNLAGVPDNRCNSGARVRMECVIVPSWPLPRTSFQVNITVSKQITSQLRCGTTPLFTLFNIYFIIVYLFNYFGFLLLFLFLRPFRFSHCQRVWIASIFMSYLSYPVQRHVIALPTLLSVLQCSRVIMFL